jgi:hypothetical protein
MNMLMNPRLVCKVVVRKANGQACIGSGYPITPNRIITASHVVVDAALIIDDAAGGEAREITLLFGVDQEDANAPVYIEWNDPNLDIAVLRCQLLPHLQPAHDLLKRPPDTPIEWFAQGYTDFGKKRRPGGKDGYYGTLNKFADNEATVALGCPDGPISSQDWAGGSGSVVFDSQTAKTALAVVIEYEQGRKLDSLIAVPICYLLSADATKDGFRQAIQFPENPDWDEYSQQVTKDIVTKLKTIEGGIESIARAVRQLTGGGSFGY